MIEKGRYNALTDGSDMLPYLALVLEPDWLAVP